MGTRRYLFIDGGYLERIKKNASERYFHNRDVPLDYSEIGKGFQKVFYYDALPSRKKEYPDIPFTEDEGFIASNKSGKSAEDSEKDFKRELSKKVEQLDKIRSIPGFHVFQGMSRYRKRQLQQKAVDVLIAVDMLVHTFLKNMDEATLLTGDLDFLPLIDALVLQGMNITLWCDESSTNKELIFASDNFEPLNVRDIMSWSSYTFQMDVLSERLLPSERIFRGKEVEHLEKVNENHETISGKVLELYKDPRTSEWVFVLNTKGAYLHLRHHDLEILKRYFCETVYKHRLKK